MASISSLCSLISVSQPPITSFFNSTPNRRCTTHHHHHHVLCCNTYFRQQQELDATTGSKRRQALFTMAFTLSTNFPALLSNALPENEDFRVYTDEVNKFQISIPQDWQVGAGESSGGFKSVTAFFPEETSTSNVSVVISGLGPDFTKMESFGKVEAFAETLVGGLDRSWQRPPGVAAKLIDSKASKGNFFTSGFLIALGDKLVYGNGFYYIEYTLQNPGESRKHLFSALGMAFNGWYNRLYTITGQYTDEDSEKYGSKIQKVVSSFRFI